MSFERFPEITATTTTDTPIVVTPAQTINWPQQVVLRLDASPESSDGWSHIVDAKGSGASVVHVTNTQRFLGTDIVIRAWLEAGPVSVDPTPALTIYRTIRGLIPGRQYRLSGRVAPDGGGTRVRLRMGGQAGAWVTATAAMTTQLLTFTATGDEEDLIVEVDDDPNSTVARAGVELAVNSISLTGLAYTQTIPAVVDDQIDLTVYDGKLTADAGWAPFIQGDIAVPEPSAQVAAVLNPNGGSRVRLTAGSIREMVPQFTPWVVTRRNIHPDPAHTGPSRAVGDGILMSCYEQMTGSNVGTTEKPNRFLLANTGTIAQEINVKTLPAGASYGLSMTTNPPANGSTKARLYIAVQLDTFTGGGAVPTTMTVGVRVVQGGTTLLTRTQNMTANGLTQLVVDEVTLNTPAGPAGIRVDVYIINRATTVWTTPGTTAGVKARIAAGAFAIADTDVPATPVITDAISVSPPLANYLRYRKVSNSVVQEQREDAPPVLQTVDTRVFDLAVAEKEIDYEGGQMLLTLASDEYLLQRFSKPADDRTPRTREHSLRSVIEYVLGEALGSPPPLSGTVDGDVTARWTITNMLLNPSVESTLDNWAAAGNCTLFHATAPRTGATSCGFTSTGAGVLAVTPMLLSGKLSVTPGRSYVFDGYGRRFTSLPAGSTITAFIRWVDANGASPWPDLPGTPVALDTAFDQRAVVIGTAPTGAVAAFPFFRVAGATAAGQIGYLDDAMFHEGTEAVPYFDGTRGTTGYTVSWAGDPNASSSTRLPLVPRDPQALTWAAGQTAWDFLTTLVNSRRLRLWCDGGRVWHLTDPNAYTAAGQLAVTPATTVELVDRISGERGEYADGVVITWTWTDYTGTERSRIESAGVKGKIVSLEIDSPYPGDGAAAGYLARLQGRGIERPVTVASDYRATPDQPITLTGPTGSTSSGEIGAVTWNLTDGLMQVEPVALTTVP